ncbi:MAG: asparagine synthase (glutamine-hydrolyzing) [Usitatibacter sp.]
MCGLSGFVDPRAASDGGELIRRMTRRLAHRGPDAEGYYEQGAAHLGHRRLAVIDIASSLQPMSTADGRYTLVYNGELYNFRALRTELESLGRVFRTKGDTEVMLQALAQWGEAALPRLQGMYAFALWDSREQSLLAARDPLGIKPLHYSWDGRLLAFASELKALVEHPEVKCEIDLDALALYLEAQYIPAPRTIYRGVHKLDAGHALTLRDGELRLFRYWLPDYSNKPRWSEQESLERLEAELRASVRSMLVADVPLGAFVSGGVDSGVIAALMTEERGAPIDTFNLGFADDTTQSEHVEAAAVAKHLGARHHALMVTPADVLKAFDGWVDVFDEPFGDQAALPTMLLSQLTRQHVTVALTGEGADELFGGYANYGKRVREERITGPLGAAWSPLRALAPHLPAVIARDRVVKAIGLPKSQRYATIPNVFDFAVQRQLFSDAFLAKRHTRISESAARFYDECNAADYIEKIMYVDMRLWLPDDLLVKVDRATMAHSLEARVPFLDHAFVEFVAKLAPGLKVKDGTRKYLLKKLAEKFLPHEIVHRPKQGFVMPLSEWLGAGLRERVDRSLGPGGLQRRGLFREGALTRLLAEHRSGRRNHAGRIWALTVLEVWFERYAPDFSL